MKSIRDRATWWAGWLTVMVVAAWSRIANYRGALGSGDLMPQGDGDSAYHLMRILRTLREFPHVSTFDPLVNWPAGAHCHWADGFDVVGAAFVKVLGAGGSDASARVAAGLWPVALGIVTVWVTIDLARRVIPIAGGAAAALAAGLLASSMPEFLFNSRFGRIDHHVFETLLMLLLTCWALRVCRPDPAARSLRARVAFEIEAGALAAAGVWFFTGSTIYVAIAVAVVVLALLAARGPQPLTGSGAAGLAAGAAAGLLLTLPALSQHGHRLSFVFPSLLQPALVAAAAAGVALAIATTRLDPGGGLLRRIGWATAAVIAFCGLVALAAPALAREVAAGISGWLLHRDPWIAYIVEFQPLFGRLAALGGNWNTVHHFFGWTGFFAPIAVPLGVWWIARHDLRRGLGFGVVTMAFVVLTLLQTRFSRILIPYLAICVAASFHAIVTVLSERWTRLAAWRGAIAGAAVAALVAADPPLREGFRWHPPARLDPYQASAQDLALDRAPVPGRRDGVAVPWTWGHWVEFVARRPVVVDGFGSYLDAGSFAEFGRAFSGTEEELLAMMERHDLGFLVAGPLMVDTREPRTDALFEGGVLNEAFMRATPLSVLAIAGSGVPATGVRHLEHLMPRFATRQIVAGIRFRLPAVWSFERVEGAVLRGTAPARSRVVAELPFREQRSPHTWKAWTDADDRGQWTMRVPFPTEYRTGTLQTAGAWAIRADEGPPVAVHVPEVAVRRGEVLGVGRLEGAAVAARSR